MRLQKTFVVGQTMRNEKQSMDKAVLPALGMKDKRKAMNIWTAVNFVMMLDVTVYLYKNGVRVLLSKDYDGELYYEVKDGKYSTDGAGEDNLESDINRDVDGWELGEEDREKVLSAAASALDTLLDVFKELKHPSSLPIGEALNSLR